LSDLAPHGWDGNDPTLGERYTAAPDLLHPLAVRHIQVPSIVSKTDQSFRSEPYVRREMRCPECGTGNYGFGLERVFARDASGSPAERARGPVAALVNLIECGHAFRTLPGARISVVVDEEPP
jgi:hypothetical protein